MRRDRLTFGMMVGIPMIQLILFGYAINSDPKHLPTAVYAADNSVFSRTIVWGLRNSSYFDITREAKNEADIQKMLAQGEVQFAVEIPVDFSRKLLRGEKPDLLLEADATDPSAVGYAIAAMNPLTTTVLNRDLTGPLAKLRGASRAVQPGHAPALQSRKHHAIQHRARPHGRDADDDDDHHHRAGHHARTRARHDGKPALHAGASGRGHHRQNRALYHLSATCRCF